MTEQEIDLLQARQETDVLVSELVMDSETEQTLSYSTDISHAWQIVEKLEPTHGLWIESEDTKYIVQFQHGMPGSPNFSIGTGKADTVSLAICKAALKVFLLKRNLQSGNLS
ncbi:MAG TPA: hypothetical protein PLP33_30325 [Leptospiraceae bacterium]|nr:hypothetical protein [Leptospiraceae bacterium]